MTITRHKETQNNKKTQNYDKDAKMTKTMQKMITKSLKQTITKERQTITKQGDKDIRNDHNKTKRDTKQSQRGKTARNTTSPQRDKMTTSRCKENDYKEA